MSEGKGRRPAKPVLAADGGGAARMTFTGIWPAMFTPLTDDGAEVDVDRLRRLLAFLVPHGIDGLFICGSTGEGVLLSPDERERVAEVTIAEVAGQIPVMVHVGALATRDSVRLAKHAARVGASAVSSIPPFLFPVSQASVIEHWRQIGSASDLPFFAYHIPRLTGHSLKPEHIAEVLTLPNVVGLKFSDPDLALMRALLDAADGRLQILSGYDQQCAYAQAAGASGAIGSTYNWLTPLFVELYRAHAGGELARAAALQAQANRLMRPALRYEVIAGQKAVMRYLGVDCGPTRHPIAPLDAAAQAELFAALDALGLKELYR